MPVQATRWRERERSRRGARALARQLEYQTGKSRAAVGHEAEYMAGAREESRRVRARLEEIDLLAAGARVLEVGSGAHGLIFFFEAAQRVGVDPLAHHYAALFPAWQRQAPTVAANGKALPFPDASFDVVLCDNVVDHAEDPHGIVGELARVLRPGGSLYFTVHVHHWVYSAAAALHRAWNAAGLHLEIGPFADHTVHLTPSQGRRLLADLPLSVLADSCDIEGARDWARATRPRHVGDRLKRTFFKNASLEVVARRTR
jgi:SAM-dependent methyltransferase